MADPITIHSITDAELTKLTRARALASGLLSVLAATVGIAVFIVSIFLDRGPESAQELRSDLDRVQTESIRNLHTEVRRIANEQRELREALSQAPATVETRVISGKVDSISRRQDGIEQVIMNNPGRALELPILRNDLNNMREVNAQRLEAIKASVEQAYDLNKWLLGTMAITIFGLALSNLLARRKPEPSGSGTSQ